MGMFSEINAASSAERLELIILDAMNGEDWFEHREIIKAFVRKNIIPMYHSEWSESWECIKYIPISSKNFQQNKFGELPERINGVIL
jgi:hypothetical protein